MVAAGVAAREIVLVEGKLLKGKVEANGNRVLGIGCDVALDDGGGEDGEDGEDVLFIVVAVRPVVRAGVVFAVVAVVVVITEVVVVLVAYNGFVVV